MAGEHERGVAQRLATRELQLVSAQHHRDGRRARRCRPRTTRRVRVEGFSKISATLRPASACEESGARLQLGARSSSASSSAALSSAPVRKWRAAWSGQSRRCSRTDAARACAASRRLRRARDRIAGCGSSPRSSASRPAATRPPRRHDERTAATSTTTAASLKATRRPSSPRRRRPSRCRAGSCRSPTATSRSTPTRPGEGREHRQVDELRPVAAQRHERRAARSGSRRRTSAKAARSRSRPDQARHDPLRVHDPPGVDERDDRSRQVADGPPTPGARGAQAGLEAPNSAALLGRRRRGVARRGIRPRHAPAARPRPRRASRAPSARGPGRARSPRRPSPRRSRAPSPAPRRRRCRCRRRARPGPRRASRIREML